MNIGSIGAALDMVQHSDGRGGAKVKAKAKSAGKTIEGHVQRRVCQKGSSGDDEVMGMWVVYSLGVVAKAVEAWHGW